MRTVTVRERIDLPIGEPIKTLAQYLITLVELHKARGWADGRIEDHYNGYDHDGYNIVYERPETEKERLEREKHEREVAELHRNRANTLKAVGDRKRQERIAQLEKELAQLKTLT